MKFKDFDQETLYARLIPAALSCFACFWIIYRYAIALRKSVGFTLILILAISDLFYSLSIIVIKTVYLSLTMRTLVAISFLTMYFSVLWASVMGYLVLKSLKTKEFNSIRSVIKMTILTISLSLLFSLGWYFGSGHWGLSMGIGLIPSIIALLLTFVFYYRSIKILKEYSSFELKSTSNYIKNLRAYSLSQFLTMGPSIFGYFLHDFESVHDFLQSTHIQVLIHSTAAFAGLVNVLLFLRQGSQSYSKPVVDESFDLSTDLI